MKINIILYINIFFDKDNVNIVNVVFFLCCYYLVDVVVIVWEFGEYLLFVWF